MGAQLASYRVSCSRGGRIKLILPAFLAGPVFFFFFTGPLVPKLGNRSDPGLSS